MKQITNTITKLVATAGAMALVGLAAIAPSAGATTTPSPGGPLALFAKCPVDDPAYDAPNLIGADCAHGTSNSGSFTIGNTTVKITEPVSLDFGYVVSPGDTPIVDAVGSDWVSSGPEQVPGGLLGLMPPEQLQQLLGLLNPVLGVTATVEPAGKPQDLELPTLLLGPSAVANNPAYAGTKYRVPVKIHLHNPVLGPDCYIGSDSDPIVLQPAIYLGGATSPPPPNNPITGQAGQFQAGGNPAYPGVGMVVLTGSELVDNAFAVPGATGCGPGGLLDSIINQRVGLPSPAGRNTVILSDTDSCAITATSTGTLTATENLRDLFAATHGETPKPCSAFIQTS